ncbi:hypothetical protein HK101_004786 [Irineochytrium annulatum]|nr:hypothetical protein HK101_004786 [Irineochytrium annulatum]
MSEPVIDIDEAAASPDRKRSLEEESASEDGDATRGGRYKRQAVNNGDSADPTPVKRDEAAAAADGNGSTSHANPGNGAVAAAGAAAAGGAEENKQMPMRAIISAKEAGIVIGKNGKNVADIRDKSGAKIQVSEQVPGALERVITVTGPLDTVAKAFSLVALKIVEELETSVDVKQRHTTIRILVPHSRMGSVIGKAGSKIKEVQDASGSRITASEEILPGSTERIVSILGVVDSIHIATYHIGVVLMDHPERSTGTVLYKPLPGVTTGATRPARAAGERGPGGPGGPLGPGIGHGGPGGMPYGGGGPGMGGPYGGPGFPMQQMGGPGGMHGMGGPMGGHGRGGPGGPGGGPMGPMGMMPMGPGGMPMGAMAPGMMQMQQIYIPNEMVGAIIGKGGQKINELRHQSGSQIKIMENVEGAAERLVTITGSPECNQMALFLLYQRLESERMRMSNGR